MWPFATKWPFTKDDRPEWQKGNGYFIYVPEGTTVDEFSVFFSWIVLAIYRERNGTGGFIMLPSRIWMREEEYAALPSEITKFLVKNIPSPMDR